MKARIRTNKIIQKELSHDEINRIFKLCCLCLNEQFGFGENRMKKFCERVSQISGTVHENPEQWYYNQKSAVHTTMPDKMDGRPF